MSNGTAERDAALAMFMRIPGSRQLSVGADRGYDTKAFVAERWDLSIIPHIAQKKRWSAIDGRTTRHERYRSSWKARKRVESIVWVDEDGGRVQAESLSWVGADRTVWGVGGDGVQPGEDVEVDGRGGDQSSHLRVAFLGRGVSVRPR